jgi:YrbI family 3-deoxy-D-manno-octulosonate 8-phosphate phosphatase
VSCVAIIPARGGSRGIPRKNICMVAGRPLLAYTIEHAKGTAAIDRIVVSTDSPDIASVAAQYGAEVVWRPPDISGDGASSESAMLHALDELEIRDGYRPDLVVLLQATSPLRHAQDAQRAIETLVSEEADSLFSACNVHGFVWRRNGHGLASFSYDYRTRKPRQQGPEDLLENGSIYVTRHNLLRETGNRLGGRIAVYRMDPLDSFQVDEPGDLQTVERLLRWRNHVSAPAPLVDVDLLVLDFDGVMTDDRVLVDQNGTEAVWCHRGDGWGIARLREAGIAIVVISTEVNPVVSARCRKLRIDAVQACDDKLQALQALARERGLVSSRIAYVGNDVNDLPSLRWVGVPIAVADASPHVRAACRHVTSRPGGRGAVREVADWILATRHQLAPR